MGFKKRFRDLEARINQLKRDLLPIQNLTGNYSPKEQDLIRAFRILSHAEFENFIEDLATAISQRAYQKFTQQGTSGRVLRHIHQSFCREKEIELSDSESDRLQSAFRKFNATVKKNHGLRSTNIQSLFLPLGIDPSEFDTAWLNSMDTFGESRGAVAHAGSAFQVTVVLDPVVENTTVTQLLTGLQILSNKLSAYKK
jgi:hypothetical protein